MDSSQRERMQPSLLPHTVAQRKCTRCNLCAVIMRCIKIVWRVNRHASCIFFLRANKGRIHDCFHPWLRRCVIIVRDAFLRELHVALFCVLRCRRYISLAEDQTRPLRATESNPAKDASAWAWKGSSYLLLLLLPSSGQLPAGWSPIAQHFCQPRLPFGGFAMGAAEKDPGGRQDCLWQAATAVHGEKLFTYIWAIMLCIVAWHWPA